MSPDKERLKAQLMAEAEAAIDRLLAGVSEQEDLQLSDIERLVRAAGQRMMQGFTGDLVAAAAQEEEERACPVCGRRMRYKGRKGRDLVTETGEVRFERGYYYCPSCRQGFFPLDRRWGLNQTIYSPELARQMVWVSGLVPYGKAKQVFERIGHRRMPAWSLWAQTRQHGKHLEAYVKRRQEHVGVARVVLPPPGCDHRQRKGVGMDGGMVHIRGEGWKEIKVGTVYDVELRLERDARTHDLVERPHGDNMAYTAVLGSVHVFAPRMWALAW